MKFFMYHKDEKVDKLRIGTTPKEIYGGKNNCKSSKTASFIHSNSAGGNDSLTIVCYLLITPQYKEWIDYIFNNWKFLNEIIKKRLDFVLVGYDAKGNFKEEAFYSFIEEFQGVTKWKWRDVPQLIIASMLVSERKLHFTDNYMTVYIDEAIKVKLADSLAELMQKMIVISRDSKGIFDFMKKVKKSFAISGFLGFVNVYVNGGNLTKVLFKGGELLFEKFWGNT